MKLKQKKATQDSDILVKVLKENANFVYRVSLHIL